MEKRQKLGNNPKNTCSQNAKLPRLLAENGENCFGCHFPPYICTVVLKSFASVKGLCCHPGMGTPMKGFPNGRLFLYPLNPFKEIR